MRQTWLFVCILILTLGSVGHAERETLLSIRDPVGDDFGAGTVLYPHDETFQPGLLDLTRFTILADDTLVYFQFSFADVTNPWNAPEGFYHQRIDVFIDSRPGIGKSEPLRPGPGEIRFHPDHPWDMWLRIAPWDGAQLFSYTDLADLPGRSEGLHVRLVGSHTIEVVVPQALISRPHPQWKYYVIVGSFDGLGIDGYREIADTPTRWLFGGSTEAIRIVDLLGAKYGPKAQRKQLQVSVDGAMALYPVGAKGLLAMLWPYAAGLAIAFTVGWLAWRRRT